jgi:hypothetical protein
MKLHVTCNPIGIKNEGKPLMEHAFGYNIYRRNIGIRREG